MLFLLTSGLLAGMLGGLLGIGGGILLMPILRFVFGLSPAYSAGTCITAVFFTTLGGTLSHHRLGHINIKSLKPAILSGALSSALFSFFFSSFARKGEFLDLGTGLVFLLISIRMITEGYLDFHWHALHEGEEIASNELGGTFAEKVFIGFLAGILPGLLGIGTGAILVPVFVFILKAPIKVAIGSSLACFMVNAFISSVFKVYQGFVDIKVMIYLCLGTLIGSSVGAIINKRFPSAILKLIFGGLFILIALKYIFLFFK